MTTSNNVSKLYHTVVEDVINNVKEAFLDEGVDEQVLQELKQLWESKLAASKALEPLPQEVSLPLAQSAAPMRMPMPIHQAQPTTEKQQQQPLPTQTTLQAQQPQGAIHVASAQPSQATIQYQPTAATLAANAALPAGMFRQHLATIGAGGQIQNIAVQQTANGQYITLPQGQAVRQVGQPQLALQHQQLGQAQLVAGQHVRAPIQTQQLLQQQQQPPTAAMMYHANQLLQQQVARKNINQLDGLGDTSSSEDDDDFDVDEKDEEDKEDDQEEEEREEEDPLNSDDDVSEEDPDELFDTDNVVVCQFDKINRNKNKWKFYLKDGIMTLNGRDFVFQKANGDAEW